MALSTNPLAKLVSSVSAQVNSASAAASGVISSTNFASLKSGLDAKVSSLSGELGSGLNGATSAASELIGKTGGALGGAASALGNIGNPIQSMVSNAQGVLAGAASSLGGAAGAISNASAAIGASLNKLGLASGGLGGGLAAAAGQISSAAGMLNNLLSMTRGKNLPSGAELFKQQGAFVELKAGSEADWRVKLNCNFGLFGGAFDRLSETGGFVWPYLPNITVASKANYSQIDPIHNIQPFYAYKNSQVDDIQISGEFSVENEMDAAYWIQGTTFLKTATKMFFGQGEHVGNPPVVCNLTGYGARIFNNVPVIVKSFSVDFKDDVNYMKYTPAGGGAPTWVPIMSTISVTVSPIYNRTRLRQFNLKDYASGSLTGYI
jgi:hypothetical protein